MGNYIPPRPPPPKPVTPLTVLMLVAALGAVLGAMVYVVGGMIRPSEAAGVAPKPETTIIRPLGHALVLEKLEWRVFDGKYNLVVDARSVSRKAAGGDGSSGGLRVDAALLSSTCGHVMVHIGSREDSPVTREGIFRLTIRMLGARDIATGEPAKTAPVYHVAVDDGVCLEASRLSWARYATFPGVLENWGLVAIADLDVNEDGKTELTAVFAQRMRRFAVQNPLESGCRAALFYLQSGQVDHPVSPTRLGVIFTTQQPHQVLDDGIEDGEPGLFDIMGGTACLAVPL